MIRSDDMILFALVAELGSFSKVAEQLDITNSVVSKRIARLESDLGVRLLYRTTRKLTLSEAGKVLYQRARDLKQMAEEAVSEVSGLGDKIGGSLKISVPTISGDLLLSEAVAEFCQLHPGLHVDMTLNNRFVDLVSEGFDLVIRTGYLENSSLIARHIIDSQWIVCAAPLYLANTGPLESPQDLTGHNCLQYAYQTTGAGDWEFKHEEGSYTLKVTGNFSTNNAGALLKAALGGHGIAYLPRCLVYRDLIEGRLVDIFPDLVAKRLGIYAVIPYTRQPTKKIQALIKHIRTRYLSMGHIF